MEAGSSSSCCNGNADATEFEEKKLWRAEDAIAGNRAALESLRELIMFPLLYSREARKLGLKWPTGLLLYGPPGTGKTSIVRAVVRESGAHLVVISPHSVHRAHAGESERILREAFADASSHLEAGKPSVVFIDEIDALCPRRDSRREQDVRLVSQLCALMDAIKPSSSSSGHVVVVASTNRVDAVDPALRRSGRFDSEVEVMAPTEEERLEILKHYTKKLVLDKDVDLQAVAASCNGYVGADLEALCREAAMSAINSANASGDAGVLCLTTEDWKLARTIVGPSLTRGVTVEVPKVSWEDIGGLQDLKVCGAELFSMYVGEGEALLRSTFQRARVAAPSIIFFDEADVVAGKRGDSSSNSSTVAERLLSTLLTEMDGLEQAKGILVLAATNRPHAIDAALMRPGRFDLVLYVPPPDKEARLEILNVHTRNMAIDDDVDLRTIAENTELFTGAELEGLCREAGIVALRENISTGVVCNHHFQTALSSLKPALTRADIEEYSSFMKMASPLGGTGSAAVVVDNSTGKKNRPFSSSSTLIKVGVLSVLVLVAAKYLKFHTKIAGLEVSAT
ncbi:unnamed protein product [Linum tenue]|uniref:AAA+ ATPase domain-containing protein n=1 Tax=Linum tenue TaxID=586396 RepID=A0AAV0GS09_9ROSI|nr:unnamed protein product [Linum tenue]